MPEEIAGLPASQLPAEHTTHEDSTGCRSDQGGAPITTQPQDSPPRFPLNAICGKPAQNLKMGSQQRAEGMEPHLLSPRSADTETSPDACCAAEWRSSPPSSGEPTPEGWFAGNPDDFWTSCSQLIEELEEGRLAI